MAQKKKYNYYKILQQNFGFGFEDVIFYPCNSQGIAENSKEIKADLKAYKENTRYATRIIFRKEINK